MTDDDAVELWKDLGRPEPVRFALARVPGAIRGHVEGCANETHALYLAHGDGSECSSPGGFYVDRP